MNKKIILSVLVIILCAIGLYVAFRIPTPAQTPVVSSVLTFTDTAHIIEFQYPKNLQVSVGGDFYPLWYPASTKPGTIVASVIIPRNTQPKTNFSEATFVIGTSTDKTAVRDCLLPFPNEKNGVATTTINGVSFFKFSAVDAGAGNYYDVTSYRTIHGTECLALEYTIHTTNINNYSPDQGITEYNRDTVMVPLEAMVQSVKVLK